MAAKLNPSEKQAQMSLALSGVSALFAVGLTVAILRNFHAEFFEVIYDANRNFKVIVLALAAVAGVTGAIGFLIGLTSAGQKRNTKSRMSWQGFFISALALTITMSMGLFFILTQNPIVHTDGR